MRQKKKILTVLGARPQFIKSKPLSDLIRKDRCLTEVIVHTGQHYDYQMSQVFYEELNLAAVRYWLEVRCPTDSTQVVCMTHKLDQVIQKESPDLVLVYGDTNSTLAGAIAAKRADIPLAHIEAGLRSFDQGMPEERNRLLTDRMADLLFAPVQEAVHNLRKEGIRKGVFYTGDVLKDMIMQCIPHLDRSFSSLAAQYGLYEKKFCVLTLHRQKTVDDKKNLSLILKSISSIPMDIIFSLHPRTYKRIKEFGLAHLLSTQIHCIAPQPYLSMLALIKYAYRVLTDSGSIQREAYLLKTPCITLRNETEWNQTLTYGWNTLVKVNPKALKPLSSLVSTTVAPARYPSLFGHGDAAPKILHAIKHFLL